MTNSDNGQELRKALEGPAKHIRVCTIDDVSFVDEVYPTGILTDKEIIMVSFSKFKNVKQNDLIEFSNEVEYRTKRRPPLKWFDFSLLNNTFQYNHNKIEIITKIYAIELMPFTFTAEKFPLDMFVSVTKQEYQCEIIISRITDSDNNTSSEPPITVAVCKEVEYGETFTVPVTKDGKNIILLPNNKYCIEMTFNIDVKMFYGKCGNPLTNEHISVMLPINRCNNKVIPFNKLYYQPHQVNRIADYEKLFSVR